ncbi:matrixin family metalloprotease [Trinickia caryophylli]|uniref:matrixin family metalloprotease n=1 Tax=Trinickia caryophylli TaxID=28094 RepID=UPI001304C0BB|nr:matrixin family metalloprotease [Trinickia caryophylli]WQE12968.1 matrixin family metalloprotease [Trinickia caryophylli]
MANEAAALTAMIPGEGMAFASYALAANIQNLAENHDSMTSDQIMSTEAAIAGDMVTIVGQGAVFLGLSEMSLNPIVGGSVITIGQVAEAVGTVLATVGASFDSDTITNIVTQQLTDSGLTQNSDGSYNPSSFSSSYFICDSSNASTMFSIAGSNNTSILQSSSELPSVTVTPSGVATVIVPSEGSEIVVTGSLNVEVVGSNNNISSQGAIITGSPVPSAAPGSINVSVIGDDNQVIGGSGSVVTSSGRGNAFDLTGSSVNVTSGDANIIGNENVIADTPGASSTLLGISGTGDLVYASSTNVNVSSGSSVTVTGSSDSISTTDARVTVVGANNDVSASSSTVTFVSGSTEELVTGSNNTINAGNSVTAQIDGNNESIIAQSGADITAAGLNDAVAGSYATINFVSGSSGELVLGSNDVINAGNSVTAQIDGNNESIIEQSGADITAAGFDDQVSGSYATINFVSGSGDELVTGSNDVINAGNSVTAQIDGNNENIIEQSAADITAAGFNDDVTANYATISFVSGSTGELIVGSYDLINASNSVTAQVDGNSEFISELSGADVTAAGAFDTVLASSATINFLSGSTNELIEGSNDIIGLGNSVTGEVVGNTDRIDGGTSDVIEVDGQYDSFYGSYDIIDYLGNATGDVITGAGDSLDFGSTGEDYGDDDYWDDDYGFYGLAGSDSVVQSAVNANIGVVAQYELNQGDYAEAVAAQLGLLQARQAAAGAAGGVGTAVAEGGTWGSNVITWSAEGGTQEYDVQIAQAFSTWAAASGLTFKEVGADDTADIRLSFADLDTADSAVAGYTTFQAKSGEIENASIELEDPSQDPLVAGADGQLTYTGTEATLDQMLLHEIGHALGLADNSDSNSIMYYELNAANRTLDATDTAGIQALYSEAPAAGGSAAVPSGSDTIVPVQLSNMLAALASFDPASSTASNTTIGGISQDETLLAASGY